VESRCCNPAPVSALPHKLWESAVELPYAARPNTSVASGLIGASAAD
jgi:hypothetical protein